MQAMCQCSVLKAVEAQSAERKAQSAKRRVQSARSPAPVSALEVRSPLRMLVMGSTYARLSPTKPAEQQGMMSTCNLAHKHCMHLMSFSQLGVVTSCHQDTCKFHVDYLQQSLLQTGAAAGSGILCWHSLH